MKARVEYHQLESQFRVVYRRNQYSFVSEPKPSDGITSCLFNDLQLEVDESGMVLYPWGLFPLPSKCNPVKFDCKSVQSGVVTIEKDSDWVPGVSVRCNREPWPVYYDESTGWMGTSDRGNCHSLKLIEFAARCIVAIEDETIHGVWIRPEIE
jgi:hypothetical protein